KTSDAPSKGPPTRPSLARNSAMVDAFQSFGSGTSCSCRRLVGDAHKVESGEWSGELVQASGHEVSEVDHEEAGGVEERCDVLLRRRVVAGKEQDSVAARPTRVCAEEFRGKAVGG